MATKTLTRLEAAKAELAAATAELDALRQQHLADESVSAEDFSHAGSRAELARLAVEGAEAADAAERAAERLKVLTALRSEIEAAADPRAALLAFREVEAGMTKLVRAIGPSRNRRISGWLNRLRALDVQETGRNDLPRDEDARLGWHGAGMLHGAPALRVKDRAIGPISLVMVINAAITRACRAADGENPGIAGVSNANTALVSNPEKWFERNV